MKTRQAAVLVFALCLIASIVATLLEPRYHAMGQFIWPGMTVSLVAFVAAHADYFRHPLLITCLDNIFNALLWTAVLMLIRSLVGRLRASSVRR